MSVIIFLYDVTFLSKHIFRRYNNSLSGIIFQITMVITVLTAPVPYVYQCVDLHLVKSRVKQKVVSV